MIFDPRWKKVTDPVGKVDVYDAFEKVYAKHADQAGKAFVLQTMRTSFDEVSAYNLGLRVAIMEEVFERTPINRISSTLEFQTSASTTLQNIINKAPFSDSLKRKVTEDALIKIRDGAERRIQKGQSFNLDGLTKEVIGKLPGGYTRNLSAVDKDTLHMAIKCYAMTAALLAGSHYESSMILPVYDGPPSEAKDRSSRVMDSVADIIKFPGSTLMKQYMQEVLRNTPNLDMGTGKD